MPANTTQFQWQRSSPMTSRMSTNLGQTAMSSSIQALWQQESHSNWTDLTLSLEFTLETPVLHSDLLKDFTESGTSPTNKVTYTWKKKALTYLKLHTRSPTTKPEYMDTQTFQRWTSSRIGSRHLPISPPTTDFKSLSETSKIWATPSRSLESKNKPNLLKNQTNSSKKQICKRSPMPRSL